MTHKLSRAELQARLDTVRTEQEQAEASRQHRLKERRYRCVRKHRMPLMIEATRKKLAMLENEARSYGLNPENY